MDTDARIADALERIAAALEQPTVLPIYRTTLNTAHEIADYLQQHAPHITPMFINTTQEEEPTGPYLMGIVG